MALNTKTSIVDYLKSINKDSSYKARQKLAKSHGINNYKGTGKQNTSLLNQLRNTQKPKSKSEQPKVTEPPQANTTSEPKQKTYVAPTQSVTTQAPTPINIDELAEKFGMDYSKEGVQQQTEAEAQAKRDAIEHQRRSVDAGIESSADALDRNYFLKGLQLSQNQTNSGLNAGIASDQNLRMAMSRQAELGDVYRDANLEKMRLEDNRGRIDLEKIARENALYNDRRQQGFQNTMNYNDILRRNYESDRNYDRGVFENDRNFDRGMFESDRGFDYGVNRDQVADERYQNEWDYQQERDQIKDAQWRQSEARKRASGGRSGGGSGMTEAQMKRLAENEFKKMREYVENNQDDLQRGSGAMDTSQMEYILEQNKKTNPPTKPNMNFTGGMLDKYKYLYR